MYQVGLMRLMVFISRKYTISLEKKRGRGEKGAVLGVKRVIFSFLEALESTVSGVDHKKPAVPSRNQKVTDLVELTTDHRKHVRVFDSLLLIKC